MRNLYGWLSGLYGENLDYFLSGYSCETQDFTNGAVYTTIGLITIGIVVVGILTFYVFIDHPRWSKKVWPWIITGLIVSIVNLLIAAILTIGQKNNGNIGDCISVETFNCWMFGLANFIVSFIVFFLLSYLLKRFLGTNNHHTPWVSTWWVKK